MTGGTTYFYAVTASDVGNHRSAFSSQASATPPSTTDLLRTYAPQLRYETQETYFADSAAEMTDNYVAGSRQSWRTASSTAVYGPIGPLAVNSSAERRTASWVSVAAAAAYSWPNSRCRLSSTKASASSTFRDGSEPTHPRSRWTAEVSCLARCAYGSWGGFRVFCCGGIMPIR